MKSIYNISKGQLITLWFFGAIGWFWALDNRYGCIKESLLPCLNLKSNPEYEVLLWLIPLILVFYTIGWKNRK